MQSDKEWAILRKANFPWEIITLDDLEGLDGKILNNIQSRFRRANLNLVRKEWNKTKEYIRNGLRRGTITIKAV